VILAISLIVGGLMAFHTVVLVSVVVKLRDRVVDLELDIARQKGRISNLESSK